MIVQVWSEIVYYADCPHCKQTNGVGVGGDAWEAGVTHDCDHCGKSFILSEVPDDP